MIACTRPDRPVHFVREQSEPYPLIDKTVAYQIEQGLGDPLIFTMAEMESIVSETRWTLVEDAPMPRGEEAELIGLGNIPCPVCDGAKFVYIHHVGKETGFHARRPVVCTCLVATLFWKVWADPKLTPIRFRQARLADMKPIPGLSEPVAVQAAFIEQAREHVCRKSFLLLGRPNSGKSHLAMAILRSELNQWAKRARERATVVPAVWRINAVEYLRECFLLSTARGQTITEDGRTFELDPEEPSVSVRKIQASVKAGFTPVLMIEELDKVSIRTTWGKKQKINEFRFNELFAVIDEVYNAMGRIIVTSNRDLKELEYNLGPNGAALIRRIMNDGMGQILDYFHTGARGGPSR